MTTGQPIRYASDRNKYNNEFNEALQLQINLNQTNLEVNRLYKQTGQLPASTQMMDTRSNEEKLMDIHNLKQSIISDLKPIAEPMFASAVIQGVIDSPLNVDNSLFRYLAQNASTFAQTLSKKYKFGIAGDANDVAIMVQFLEDAYNKTKNSFQSIKGYINSNTNEGNKTRSNTLSANDTDNVKLELVNVIKRFEYINNVLAENIAQIPANVPNLIGELGQTTLFLAEVNSFLPTSAQMNDVIEILARSERVPFMVGALAPPPADRDLLLAVLKILKTIPRAGSIATLLDMCDRALDSGDYGRLYRTIQNIKQLFSQFISPENRQLLRDFRNEFLEKAREMEEEKQKRSSDNLVSEMKLQNENEAYQKNAKRVYIVNPANDPVWTQGIAHLGQNVNVGYDEDEDGSQSGSNMSINPNMRGPIPNLQGSIVGSNQSSVYGSNQGSSNQGGSNQDGSQFGLASTPINSPVSSADALLQATGSFAPFGSSSSSSSSKTYSTISASTRMLYRNFIQNIGQILQDVENSGDAQKRAFGDNVERRVQAIDSAIQSDSVPFTQGINDMLSPALSLVNTLYAGNDRMIMQERKKVNDLAGSAMQGNGLKNKIVKKGRGLYSPFGDSEINHKNLENNILTLRRKSKTNYMDLPSKHISKHMKNIIHNIVGGKIANYEDLHNLNDEERNYLNKVISKSNLHDRLSVPAPSKDQADKDNHQWEVMRGEIMAGNDSKELVKKFKILTMKLTRQGLLPKNEVMDLFEDLVNLGY